MKRGLSYLICANLFIAMFIGGLISINTVNAYIDPIVGDQVLYEINDYREYNSDYQYWFESEPAYPYDYEKSRWNIYTDKYTDIVMQSFYITQDYPSYVYVNDTYTRYAKTSHYLGDNYNYDYSIGNWVYDYGYDDFYYENYNWSSFGYDYYYNLYPNNMSIDPIGYFGSAIYNYSTTITITINGASSSLPVDVYTYETASSSISPMVTYNVTWDKTYTDTHNFNYYVDSVTGLLVQLDILEIYTGDGSWSGYSDVLGMMISGHEHYEDKYIEKWKLYETNMAYGSVSDADIPSLMNVGIDVKILDGDTFVDIPTYINDAWSSVTVEIFVDGNYYTTMTGVSTGDFIFSIPVSEFIYNGPNWDHEVRFDVYDEYNFNHNSTWNIWVDEERVPVPSWGPSYLTGPTEATIIEGDYYEYFSIWSDTNWTIDYYKYNGSTYNWIDWDEGYQNLTVSFWDYLTPGTYEYWIHLLDNEGYTDDIYLTVTVNPADAPQILGPSGEYAYSIGDTASLWWELKDNDPDTYSVKLDSTIIISNASYTDGMYVNIKLQDLNLTTGDHDLSIFATDLTGYETVHHLIIHVSAPSDILAPTITGSSGTIYMEEGEAKKLEWTLSDDNPSYYKVYENGTKIIDKTWTNNNEVVTLDLSTLTIGTWNYLIEAYDSYGNNEFVEVWVVVEEAGSTNETEEPTTPGDENTINLDAPGILYAAIGFLSIAALTVVLRRRN